MSNPCPINGGIDARRDIPHIGKPVIADLIRSHATVRGDAIALTFEGRDSSYAVLDAHASRVAAAMVAMGLSPGDRIAFLGKNSDLYFEYWLGAAKAAVVLVPINWRLAAPEVAYIVGDARPRLVLADPEFLDRLDGQGDYAILTTEPVAGRTDFAAWRDAQAATDPHRDAGYDAPVLQLYTSGTTGNPKGALLTNRSLLALRQDTPDGIMPAWNRWSAQDVALIAMPIFHISGSGWGLWSLQHGGKGVVVREFDPHKVLGLLTEHRITKIMMVPTAMRIVCDHPAAATTDFSFLQTICYGGSAIPLDLMRQAIAVFGCGFAQMYGPTRRPRRSTPRGGCGRATQARWTRAAISIRPRWRMHSTATRRSATLRSSACRTSNGAKRSRRSSSRLRARRPIRPR